MESPVRSVETTAGSGENGGGGGGKEDSAAESSSSQRFEAKSYLERQVEELSCADEDEAQEKVSQRLQLKQERAKKKRDIQLQRRRKGIAERLHKIREAREAVDARFAENALQLMERQAEKQTSATRRRRTSLENIKKARAVHNRRVNQRRRESFDDASGESPARIKGMHEFESKLARAERNRENLRRERRRRAMERYEEGKARALEQGASSSTSSGGGGGGGGVSGIGGGSLLRAFGATSATAAMAAATTTTSSASTTDSASVKAGRENRRRRAVEARQAAKARQTKRMRDLRQRMLSQRSPRVSERKTRVFAARLLQEWWRCVRVGKAFSVTDLAISSPEGTPLQRSPLGSPSAWATTQGLGLSLTEGLGAALMAGEGEGGVGGGGDGISSAALGAGPMSALDPCTRSPLPTTRKFSPGVGGGVTQRGFGFGAGLGSGAGGGGGGGAGSGGGSGGGGGGSAGGGGVGFGVGVGAGSVGACTCSVGAGAGAVGAGAGSVGVGASAVGTGAGGVGAGAGVVGTSAGVGSNTKSVSSGSDAVAAAAAAAAAGRYGFGSNHKAALAIQSFLRRNMHSLKVANALLAGRLSVKVLCAAVRTMATSTFDEAIEVMSTRAIVSHCETALKALRMGREMRSVPQTVRSARAFLSALLVNFFPTSALDDEGALSSSPEGTAPLQLEKERLVRASGNAIKALLDLEATMDAAAAAAAASAVVAGGGVGGGGRTGRVGDERERVASSAFRVEQFPKIRRASATMVRARVAFCRRFAEWKRKDAMRLADEMTAASVDVLFMQLRAERDLQVAAARYGIEEADDGGALFSTGFEQIKEGTQRQLGKMMHALGKLVGPTEARQRMDGATDAAFERLRADELAEDEEFLREHGEFADERMDTDDGDYHHRHHHHRRSGSSSHLSGAEAAAAGGGDAAARATGAVTATEAAAALLGKGVVPEEEDDIAGPRRPLSAGDLLSNEWLVHEVMISDETLTVTLEEAVENQLLRSGSPAAAAATAVGSEDGANLYWETVERHVAAEDYTPLLGLVAELRDKIIGLTPRRRDLAAETCEAMDVELLEQMVEYGAFDVGCFFRMVAFAGERVLELEAPIRNEGTKATLAGWGRTQDEVEGGRRRLEPAMVRECFEYLFSKTDEIHVDILNAHLQFVTPFLKQHGVEYERDRFTEKLDAGETSLDMTHLWLHRAIRQLRAAAGVAPSGATTTTATASGGGGAVASPPPPPPTAAAAAEVEFYRQLVSDLEQRRGDAYLKLLRVAIVDNLLGAIVCVERKTGAPPTAPSPPSPPSPTVGVASASAGAGAGSGKAAGAGMRAGAGVGGAAGAAVAAAAAAAERDDQQEDMLEGVAVPETLMLDRYRLVVIAAAAEQAAYTASLVAFARQALATMRMGLVRADEDRVRDALMVLFETEDVTSADICAQVAEMTRVIAVTAGRALPASQLSMLSARSRNVLTTGDCPVYKLFLRRTLSLLRHTLVEGGMSEDGFTEALRKAGLFDYKDFLLERVVRPLVVIERHNEAVFATFYNEIIPLALRTTTPAMMGAHAKALDVD